MHTGNDSTAADFTFSLVYHLVISSHLISEIHTALPHPLPIYATTKVVSGAECYHVHLP